MATNTLGFPALKDGPHPQGHSREPWDPLLRLVPLPCRCTRVLVS